MPVLDHGSSDRSGEVMTEDRCQYFVLSVSMRLTAEMSR